RDVPALLDTLWAIALDHERRALDGAALEPGARDAVEGARAAGFAVALWTNNARAITADVLGRFGLLGEFDFIVTRDEMEALKPDPAGGGVIRGRWGDGRGVVVGDSGVDGVAAAAAGVPFVAYRPRLEDLERWQVKPETILVDLATLPEWLAANFDGRGERGNRREISSAQSPTNHRPQQPRGRRRPAPSGPRRSTEVGGRRPPSAPRG